ncbi:hypothetical protein BTJ49_00005 [Oleiagrimonas sp. MCCC 1A03011]|nr:hypothetical protein BTJ49_00005 [Oleiagrimonas sp. MCCC 1A03011]
MVSKEAAGLAKDLVQDGRAALELLRRDLESWNLGFERLRTLSLERLTTIWTTPRTSIAELGQDAAGGHHKGTIRRNQSFSALCSWWTAHATTDAPATVIGWEGVGKTWAVLDWLADRKQELPIVLLIPSSAVAGLVGVSKVAVKKFVGERLYELVESRDPNHWYMRFERLLSRPVEEGPVITILFDGMNQEPSMPWLTLMRAFQDTEFAGRVRLILTTRNLHFTTKLASLRGLFTPPEIITVDIYDDAPGGEFDKRLQVEGLSRSDLHDDLIPLARTPRLFNLVIRFRDDMVEAGQVTVHRLLWEYGRDTVGTRAGKSFSEEDWRSWLQEIAQRHLAGTRDYNLRELADTTHRSDLTPTDVFRRLSDIVDAQFTTLKSADRRKITPLLVTHALAAALLADLDELSTPDCDAVDRRLAEWFDPIDGLDEKAEILRAGVSILLERDAANTPSTIVSGLVLAWLRSQNVPDEHRNELARLAIPLCDALLDAIEQAGDRTHKSARLWAVNAIRAIPRSDMSMLAKIVERLTGWLRIVSRDVDPPQMMNEESERARVKRIVTRIGFDADGEHTVLGHRLIFVDRHYYTAAATIPSILEGFTLATALPVFEASALAMAIRDRQEYREGLTWLCLMNNVDFEATARSLRKRAKEIAAITPERGVHLDLPRRVAALLLWLTGDENDETAAAKLNPSIDRTWSYERDYEANPATSFFQLERRHAEQVLQNRSIAIFRRINRTQRFFSDPSFVPPPEFSRELGEFAAAFDVSALDTSRFATAESNAFESLAPVLARCSPEALADLMRRKLAGLADRPAEQRLASAVHATEQLLLASDESAAAARVLRLSHTEPEENDEASVATLLLIIEIQDLAAVDQITTIIEADLKWISSDLGDVLKSLSNEEADALARRYSDGTEKQVSDLVLLMSQSVTSINEDTWHWLTTLALNRGFVNRGVACKMLYAIDSQRFGVILANANWTWQPDENMWSNHYGSLALMDATAGLPESTRAL